EQSWKLALPEFHELIVHCAPSEEPGERRRRVSLHPLFEAEGGDVYWDRTQYAEVVDGQALFRFLVGGDYRLRVGRKEMQVSVRSDQRIDFTPTVYDCAEITISDASGSLAGWGFRTGDKIISVDGRPVDPPDFRILRFAFAITGTRPITVLRGGQTLELTVTIGEDPSWDLGGDIQPAQR
ncbi:MAG: hypothetical protein AAF488_07780, partial [Planctomycetota bacterium]